VGLSTPSKLLEEGKTRKRKDRELDDGEEDEGGRTAVYMELLIKSFTNDPFLFV
jgi:hypothetical protein